MMQLLFQLLGSFLFLLPKSIFYGVSDLIACFLRVVIKYRKKVIELNLKNAFPEFSDSQIQKVKNEFYKNLTDQFLEMLIMAAPQSYSYIEKNYFIDLKLLNELYEQGKSVLMVLGHQFNWEWGLWILSKKTKFHVQGVYMPIKNRKIDKLLKEIRGYYGAEMVPANQVRSLLKPPTDKPTLTLIIGDQSPANLESCYWTNFFHQETAFINAYEKIAHRRKMAVVFIEVLKVKRGIYQTPYFVFSTDASLLEPNKVIENFVQFLENSIRKNPPNWLWSHRRWKHKRNSD